MEPITRVEMLIDAIVKSEDPNIVAITRIEGYLNDILAGTPSSVVPVTRIEIFLAAISGVDIEVPKPITRLEMFLAKIAGEDIDLPEPITRLEYFLSDWAEEAEGGERATVVGGIPLALNNALAKALISLKQYGKIYQSATLTPSTPQNIVCNNGTLQMVHASSLPSDYKLLDYVGGSGSQYVITNVYLASTDVIECEYQNSSTTGYGAIYGIYKTGESSALYGNQTYYGYDDKNNKVDSSVHVDTEWHSSRHDFVNGTLTIDGTTVSFTPWEFENSTKNAVLSRFYNGSYGYNWKGYVRKFKVTRGNEVICDLIPAKNSSDVAGFYDLATGDFYTPTGGTLLEGNVVNDYELAIVGTPEMLSLGEQTATVANLYAVGDYADEQEIISGILTRKVGMVVLDGKETGWALSDSGTTHRFRGTKPSDCITPASRAPIASTHFKYNATGQATGGGFIGASTYWYFIPEDQTIDTSDKWKEWLAGQYAAGTPVIVFYPLAQEATEQVSPQALKTEDGDNTLTGTINVSDVQFEATYIKGVTPAPQNLFDPTKAVVGREVDATAQYGGWYGPGAVTLVGSDYMPVVAGKYYEFGIEHTRGSSTSGLAFYNDVYVGEEDSGWKLDYQCVGTITLPNLKDAGYVAVAPAGATKMMFCFNSSFNPDWQNSVTVYETVE